MVEWIWKCEECGSVQTAKSYEWHTMSYCECKESFVDLEEGYVRMGGEAMITEKVFNVRDIVLRGTELFKNISREEYYNKKLKFVDEEEYDW